MTEDRHVEVGSIGEELQRLTAAIAQWAGTHRAGQARDAQEPTEAAGRPASCDYCPLCQLIAIGRGQRPEAVAKLIDTATVALHALTDYLQAQDGHRGDTAPEQAEDPGPSAQPRVQHIDVE